MSPALPFSPNSRIDSIVPYVPGKPAEELERELGLKNTVKLASNENPLGPSPVAVEAMRRAAASCHRYPDGGGFYLKKRLAERLDFPPECLILGNGSTEIVEMLAKAFLPPDGESLVAEGAFMLPPKHPEFSENAMMVSDHTADRKSPRRNSFRAYSKEAASPCG